MGIILKMLLSLALLTEKILLASEKVHFNVVRQSNMDYFILVINKDEHIISSEFALNYDGVRSDCGMKVDRYSLFGKERQSFIANFAVFLFVRNCEIFKTVFQNGSADSY